MDIFLQIKYLMFLPITGLVDKGNRKWNGRCPICGDSNKSSTKKRFWVTEYKNSLYVKCYNCDYSNSFHQFLKYEFPNYYSDYITEKFQDNKPITKKSFSNIDIFAVEYDTLTLQKLNDLPDTHKAVIYIRKRMITKEMSKDFYYSDNFSKWLNDEIDPKAINFKADMDRRIVIPFFNKHKKIFAVQGRSIDNIDPKYITYKMNKNESKIYGLDIVDFTKTVYVVEGPFDSLFISNCLAVGGTLSNLSEILKYTSKNNIVVVPDNDKRNYQTDMFIQKTISDGFNVVIWNKNIKFKDLNEAIIKGISVKKIMSYIKNNTYSGLMAEVKQKMKGTY